MAKESVLISVIAWLVGVIVSLAVGFALISGTLAVPQIGAVNIVAGWIVVIGAVISVIMAIFNR